MTKRDRNRAENEAPVIRDGRIVRWVKLTAAQLAAKRAAEASVTSLINAIQARWNR